VHHGNLELRTLVSNTTTSLTLAISWWVTKLLTVSMHQQIHNCRHIKYQWIQIKNCAHSKSTTGTTASNDRLLYLYLYFQSDVLNNTNIKDFLYTLKCHQKLKNTCCYKNLPYKITTECTKKDKQMCTANFWVDKR
jgi:hypothetical protein